VSRRFTSLSSLALVGGEPNCTGEASGAAA